MNLFAQARAGLNLTPGQRTVLRAVEMIALAAVVSFLTALPALTSGAKVNGGAVAAAFGVAMLASLSKYLKAHGDAPLGDAADAGAAALRRFGDVPNDVVIEPELPALPADQADAAA